jgi:hypothetical protein
MAGLDVVPNQDVSQKDVERESNNNNTNYITRTDSVYPTLKYPQLFSQAMKKNMLSQGQLWI